MVPLFLRLTLVVAFGLVALMLLAFLVKIVFVAAVVAALVVGVILALGFVRRLRARAGPVVQIRR